MKNSTLSCLIQVPRVKDRASADKVIAQLNEGLNASTIPGDPKIISYSLVEKPNNKLALAVIERIKADLAQGETESLYELLAHVPRACLIHYLPEEDQGNHIPARYYQPLFDKQVEEKLFSFQVFSSKAEAEAQFPGKKINAFSGQEIQEPQVMDW